MYAKQLAFAKQLWVSQKSSVWVCKIIVCLQIIVWVCKPSAVWVRISLYEFTNHLLYEFAKQLNCMSACMFERICMAADYLFARQLYAWKTIVLCLQRAKPPKQLCLQTIVCLPCNCMDCSLNACKLQSYCILAKLLHTCAATSYLQSNRMDCPFCLQKSMSLLHSHCVVTSVSLFRHHGS